MAENKSILMVVSDIDGTLLRSDGTISQYTVDVIHQAQGRGILFTVCSGRYPEHADVILRTYGIRCPVTGNNGCTQWDARTDTVLRDHFLDPVSARLAREAADDLNVNYMVFGRKAVAACNTQVMHSSQAKYGAALARDYHIVFTAGKDAVDAALHQPVNKFYFHYDNPEDKQRLIDALSRIPNISITTSGYFNVEIIPIECNKAAGAAEMARLYGIDMARVMTLGDYENDVTMLQAAGLGVAMGNASAEVRALADCVTDTNDRDGVAKAIEKYVFNV